MEHVCCPTLTRVWNEDNFRVYQRGLAVTLCKPKRHSLQKGMLITSSSPPYKRPCCSLSSFKKRDTIHAYANGTTEYGALAEQKSVDMDATPTLLDGKSVNLETVKSQVDGSGSSDSKKESALKGIFPGGLRRAEVRLPGLVMTVRIEDVLGPQAREFLDKLDSAIAAGFTMIVLESGNTTADGDDSSSGARLYEAARLLKATLRGRAELLIADRVDITAAAAASGVLLSDDGLPAVVARSMLQKVSPNNPVLPLVARRVSSAESALLATASEGADFLIVQDLGKSDAKLVINEIRERVSIPIFFQGRGGLESWEDVDLCLLKAGANGLLYSASDLKNIIVMDVSGLVSSFMSAMFTTLQRRSSGQSRPLPSAEVIELNRTATDPASFKSSPLEVEFREILEEERSLFTSMIKLLKEASPEMEEVSLLVDAVAQLDEPFLLMVVGEFNSGKSSVINALLGKRYLPEGVLPTTNEIALLKYAGDGSNDKERSERHPDGHFIYYLPAELLKEINLVDTPGTNVILKRQQRLTEEFVPRADLVLFVLSADRPFTESEMTFLKYIMQWEKRIIFLLNKSDIFSEEKELEDVVKFVRDNAQRLLSIEKATIYAVSARKAFQAKKEVGVDDGNLAVEEVFQNNTAWNVSGFRDLEKFIAEFLGGSSDAGVERRRLKLATPLGIALTLLDACKMQLSVEESKADADMELLNRVLMQLEGHQKTMEYNATVQRQRLMALIDGAKGRAEMFVDSILRLSNIDAVASYLLGGDRQGRLPVTGSFDAVVMGSVQSDLQRVLEEHHSKLADYRVLQVAQYNDFVTKKWPDVKENQKKGISNTVASHNARQGKETESLAVLDGFDTKAAKIVLEKELKDVIFGTFGGLGAAGLSASVLTSVLPSTLEDLVALAVCSAGGLVGVWNLPNRREEVKRKVSQVAESFTNQLEAAMLGEVEQSVKELREEVDELLQPYFDTAEAEVERIRRLNEGIAVASGEIQRLRLRVQNLGVS